MTRTEFREVINRALNKKGIKAFEKNCATIKWLHYSSEEHKKYLVFKKGEIVFEADNLQEIAKKYGVAYSSIWQCLHSARLLDDQYLIMKSEEI